MYVNFVYAVCTMDTETKKFRLLLITIEIILLYTKRLFLFLTWRTKHFRKKEHTANIEVITLYFGLCR